MKRRATFAADFLALAALWIMALLISIAIGF